MVTLKQVAEAAKESLHSADIEHVYLHGDRVYTCADDGMVKIWSTELKLEKELHAHDYAVYHMLIINDKLFTASIDTTIKVWNLSTLELLDTLKVHEESVRKLATSGTKMYSGDEKGHVIMWASSPIQQESRYEVVEEVWDLKAKDKYFVSVRDRGVSVTEVQVDGSNKYTVVASMQGRAPLYLSDNYLAYAQFGSETYGIVLHQYHPTDFPKIKDIKGHDKIVTCMDGSVVGGTSERLVSGGYDNKINMWELPAGNLIAQGDLPITPTAVAAAADGAVYVGGPDGYLVKLATS